MKLYMHPVSMTSRPVRLFMAEKGLKADEEVVDLMTGAHFQEPYASLNPNKLVPMLEDDGFKLTESSAILKYLADKFDLPDYPKDLKQRAQGQRDHGLAQHQLLSRVGLRPVLPAALPASQAARRRTCRRRPSSGARSSRRSWLQVLNDHWIGPNNQYLGGNTITIADYFGAGLVTLGELIRCDFTPYPNVTRWLDNMKKLKSWPQVNEVFDGFKQHAEGSAVRGAVAVAWRRNFCSASRVLRAIRRATRARKPMRAAMLSTVLLDRPDSASGRRDSELAAQPQLGLWPVRHSRHRACRRADPGADRTRLTR